MNNEQREWEAGEVPKGPYEDDDSEETIDGTDPDELPQMNFEELPEFTKGFF